MLQNISRILIPIDFSDVSKNTLKHGVRFAERFHAEVLLVYVIEPVKRPRASVLPAELDWICTIVAPATPDMSIEPATNAPAAIENRMRNSFKDQVVTRGGMRVRLARGDQPACSQNTRSTRLNQAFFAFSRRMRTFHANGVCEYFGERSLFSPLPPV